MLVAPGVYRENTPGNTTDTVLKFGNYKVNAPLVIEGAGWNSASPQNTGDVIISGSDDWSRKNSAAPWTFNSGTGDWTPPAPDPGVADSAWVQNANGTWSKPWIYSWGLEARQITGGVFIDAVRRRELIHVNGVTYYPVNPPSDTWPFYQNADSFEKYYTSIGSGTNEIRVIAKAVGAAGNGISIEIKNPGASGSPLSVSLASKAITVNLGTNSGGAISSTSNGVRDALLSNSSIAALVDVTSGGSGIAPVQSKKFLGLPAALEGDAANGGRVSDDEGSFWVTNAYTDGNGVFHHGTITLIPPVNQASININSALVEVSTKSRMVFLQAFFNKTAFDSGQPETSQATNVIFRNITVEQSNNAVLSGAFFQYQNKLLIEDCRFINQRWTGIQLNACVNVTLRRVEISGNGNNGAGVNLVQNCLIERTSFNRNSRLSEILGFTGWSVCGVKLMRCPDTTLYRCEAIDNRSTGFWWDGGAQRCELMECIAAGNSSNGTFIEVNSDEDNNYVTSPTDVVRGIPGLGSTPTVTVTRCIISGNRPKPDAASYRTNKGRGVFFAENENGQIESSLIYDNDIQVGTYDGDRRAEGRDNGVKNSAIIATASTQRLFAVASEYDSSETLTAKDTSSIIIKGGWYAFFDGLNGTNTNDNAYFYPTAIAFPSRAQRYGTSPSRSSFPYQPPTLLLSEWRSAHLSNSLDVQTPDEAVDSRSRLVTDTYAQRPLVVANADVADVPESSGTVRVFTIHRVSPGGYDLPLTVNYSFRSNPGDAQSGVDFPALSGSVVIPAGERSVGLSVDPSEDDVSEGDETIALVIQDTATYITAGNASVVIDDIPPTLTNLTASIGSGTRVDLAWQNPGGYGSPVVIERSEGNQTYAEIVRLPAGTLTFSDEVRVRTLNYRVRAAETIGVYSNVSSVSARNPYSNILANSSNLLTGANFTSGGVLGGIYDNYNARYDDVNFINGTVSFTANLAQGQTNVTRSIEIRVGSPTGTLLGTLPVASTGSWGTYQDQSITLATSASGLQTLFLVFKGGPGVCNLKHFRFTETNPQTVPSVPNNLTASPESNRISLAWSAPDAGASQQVEKIDPVWGAIRIATLASPATMFIDSGLVTGSNCNYQIRTANSAGASAFLSISATAADALDNWRFGRFGIWTATGDAANDADPDKNGVMNLAEYALGIYPAVPGSIDKLPKAEMNPATGRMKFIFMRTRADIDYIIRASGDLGDWSEIIATNPGNVSTVVPVVVEDSVSTANARFMRLELKEK